MNINDFIITFAKALKADYFFKNIKIIKPFECIVITFSNFISAFSQF